VGPNEAQRCSGLHCEHHYFDCGAPMSIDASLSFQTQHRPSQANSSRISGHSISELNALAARGLIAMFDPDRQLFCQRLIRAKRGLVRAGVSPRYTIMTLLGLRELDLAGGQSSFDTNAIYKSFVLDTSWIRSIGDLGLLIWLTAAFAPEELERRFLPAYLEVALNRYPDARKGSTMELAWFLAGLAHAGGASPGLISSLAAPAGTTYRRLKENQGESGLFGHLSTSKSVVGLIRGRIGSFADQIYPVYALSKFATTFHQKEPLELALKCAATLCGTQGTMGQWWWLYEARTGKVLSRYPVYSVHQHGMAPMGLLMLEEASGQSFKEFIDKGLEWIYGRNELGTDMRDLSQNVIWRCIRPKRTEAKYWQIVRNLLGARKENVAVGELYILFEDWPYELGWLLYAFAKYGVE
jgi:hypothetical protein